MRAFSKLALFGICVISIATKPTECADTSNLMVGLDADTRQEPDYYKLPTETQLSAQELVVMKKALCKAIDRYNHNHSKDWQINLSEYGVQYKVSLNKEGKKIVWINGFCKESGFHFKNLDFEIVSVLDGGSCFFNTTIDIESGKIAPIRIHGFA